MATEHKTEQDSVQKKQIAEEEAAANGHPTRREEGTPTIDPQNIPIEAETSSSSSSSSSSEAEKEPENETEKLGDAGDSANTGAQHTVLTQPALTPDINFDIALKATQEVHREKQEQEEQKQGEEEEEEQEEEEEEEKEQKQQEEEEEEQKQQEEEKHEAEAEAQEDENQEEEEEEEEVSGYTIELTVRLARGGRVTGTFVSGQTLKAVYDFVEAYIPSSSLSLLVLLLFCLILWVCERSPDSTNCGEQTYIREHQL